MAAPRVITVSVWLGMTRFKPKELCSAAETPKSAKRLFKKLPNNFLSNNYIFSDAPEVYFVLHKVNCSPYSLQGLTKETE